MSDKLKIDSFTCLVIEKFLENNYPILLNDFQITWKPLLTYYGELTFISMLLHEKESFFKKNISFVKLDHILDQAMFVIASLKLLIEKNNSIIDEKIIHANLNEIFNNSEISIELQNNLYNTIPQLIFDKIQFDDDKLNQVKELINSKIYRNGVLYCGSMTFSDFIRSNEKRKYTIFIDEESERIWTYGNERTIDFKNRPKAFGVICCMVQYSIGDTVNYDLLFRYGWKISKEAKLPNGYKDSVQNIMQTVIGPSLFDTTDERKKYILASSTGYYVSDKTTTLIRTR